MRISKFVLGTLKEEPADAVVKSHRLMIRGGLMRKESAGMYAYLPMGLRVLRKITDIVRDEMDASGAHEFLMPEMTSADLWKESGRWNTMGPEMFRIKDRNSLEYSLAPTHEEAFTALVRSLVSSYRDLPLTAYQINTKFRDEIRPRFGVIRSKEFIMKDAYSFDLDENGLDESYQSMRKAYRKIFERCGLDTIPVEADTGNMGGSNSEEFMVASEVGEETLLLCDSCSYRANQEKAEYRRIAPSGGEAAEKLEEVSTPGIKTIDQLVSFFKTTPDKFLKSIVYIADGKPVMAVVTGDREINEIKLRNALGAAELELAPDAVVEETTKAPVGFAGPAGDFKIRVIFDLSVENVKNAITGANKKDYHFRGVNPGRDFQISLKADITSAAHGDECPRCGKPMYTRKGLEVGHIFKLGYKYTKSMNVNVLSAEGKPVTPVMGCYGIGINRTMAAIIEQHSDDKGIIWPVSVAPFQVLIVGISKTDEEACEIDSIYGSIKSAGFEVLYDDRSVSPGIKFADADLIGIPLRITVGKGYFQKGEIEIKIRKSGEVISVARESMIKNITAILASLS